MRASKANGALAAWPLLDLPDGAKVFDPTAPEGGTLTLVHPDDRERELREAHRWSRDYVPDDVRVGIRQSDGTVKWLEGKDAKAHCERERLALAKVQRWVLPWEISPPPPPRQPPSQPQSRSVAGAN